VDITQKITELQFGPTKKLGKLGLQVDSHPSPFTSHCISAKFCQGTMDASKKGLAVSGGERPSSPRKPHRNWMVPSHITESPIG